MTDTLIRTKLHIPFTRSKLVPRPRLQTRLAEGLRGPLTLITAPAGFGKTTLVTSGVAGSGMSVAWLSLDKNDNQSERFLSYLIAALQEADSAIGSETAQLLAAACQAPPEAVLTSLINDLDSAGEEIVLVLDDYQFIYSQAVHDQVVFLLEHSSKTFHLVIASRSDPPLLLARLRGRGQMVELRAADLSFTEPEAAQFLNEVMGLHLDAGSIATLEERTEGWIAGLQMAALSMRDRKDVFRFIEEFSGTNRYILDYLLEEVMASQPPEIQQFLLCTSILERLSAPLCEAVLGDRQFGAGRSSPIPDPLSCQQVLESLERKNLFLVPLDDERRWFRYHHLFADLLAAQLARTDPESIPELHARASAWYEQNGYIEQAIEHAFSASNLERVGQLIEYCAQKLIYQVSFETQKAWIDRLPEEMVVHRAWLGISQGWLWVVKMKTTQLESWIDQVEEYFESGGKDHYPDSEQQDIHANLYSLRAYAAFFQGDLQRCVDLSLKALNQISPANGDLCIRILVQLGETYLALMQLDQASAYLSQAIETGIKYGDFQSVATATMRLYRAFRILGRLNEAELLIHMVFQGFSQAGRLNSPVATKLEQCWGDLLRERGHLSESGDHLARGLEAARQYHSPLDIVTALVYQSMWLISQSDLDGAQIVLDEAGSLIHSFTIPAIVISSWSRQQARLCLEKGDLESAGEYLGDSAREEAGILQSKLLFKKGDLERACELLLQLEQDADAGKRYGNLVQIWLLKAIGLQALGRQPDALDTLVKCLALAQPQAYLMTILDEGEPVYEVLQLLRARALPQILEGYVTRLLQVFEERKKDFLSQNEPVAHKVPTAQEIALRNGDLVEPLSSRELEVLELLAQGKTNLEIARQLFIAPGTVKAHTASIYRKLDVANRTEAVARARQLAILP